jgi:molybdopterin synthase sulfur carrier subunit
MSISIRIPANMRSTTDGQACIESEGESVAEAIHGVCERFPELKTRLLDDSGELLSYVNVFLGDTNICDLAGLETQLENHGELLIVSALAGG